LGKLGKNAVPSNLAAFGLFRFSTVGDRYPDAIIEISKARDEERRDIESMKIRECYYHRAHRAMVNFDNFRIFRLWSPTMTIIPFI